MGMSIIRRDCNRCRLRHWSPQSHIPDLDIDLLEKNFKCATDAERDALVDSTLDTASMFVASCGFSIRSLADVGQDISHDTSGGDGEE